MRLVSLRMPAHRCWQKKFRCISCRVFALGCKLLYHSEFLANQPLLTVLLLDIMGLYLVRSQSNGKSCSLALTMVLPFIDIAASNICGYKHLIVQREF